MMKLDMQHKHILKLIDRDSDDEGWTSVSEPLFPVISKNIPAELVIFEKLEVGGRARLTTEGKSVIFAMQWI